LAAVTTTVGRKSSATTTLIGATTALGIPTRFTTMANRLATASPARLKRKATTAV
jgi:hypothetical protein